MSIIVDIIKDVVDVVVDIVDAVVDLVVDVIEVVVEAVVSLLGFNADDQVIEYFEVYNQPLFSTDIVDRGISQEMMASALYNDININSAITYNAIFGDSIPKSLKQFIRYIDNNNYYTGFPEVESFLNYVDEAEVIAVLNSIHGAPCSLDNSLLGRLTIPTWIEWWLHANKSYNLDTGYIGIYDIGYDSATYNTATDDYTIPTSYLTSSTTTVTTTAASNSSSTNYAAPLLIATDTIGFSENVDIVLNYVSTGTLPYNVPSKPVGAHIISNYHLDSAPTNRLLFKYKLGEGTYPDLDDSETDLGLSSSALQTLPAVPVRLNNINYIGGAHETQITDLLATMKLDGAGILEGITQDYTGSMSDLDHIYVNFGVRVLDTSQGALKYLFSLFENLHTSNAVTEAQYTAATGEKPYNNLIVTHDDYKYIFKYAFTTYTHSTVAEVNADTDLSNIYYSKTSHFDDSNVLIKPYYASTAQVMYKVQYQADNLSEVNSFLAGSGVPSPGATTTEGANKLQVTTRIAYSGTIYDSKGVDSGQSILKPDLVYENDSGLKIVNSINEETTQSQEIIYYEIVANGLNSYKVKAPIAALNVKDAESGKFKLVKFNLANPNDLMLPFFYGALPSVNSKDLASMWLASAHTSTYIARYEVIENNGGGFLKVLIMIVIIVIIAVVTGYIDPTMLGFGTETLVVSGTAETGTLLVTNALGVVTQQTVVGGVVVSSSIAWGATAMSLASSFVVNQLISYAIQHVAEDISPELAMVLGAALQFKFGMGKNIDFSSSLSVADAARVTAIVVNSYSGVQTIVYNMEGEEEERKRLDFSERLDTAYKSLTDLAEIEETLNLGDHYIPGLHSAKRGYIVPDHAESFYANALSTPELSTLVYNFDYKINQGYSFDVQYQQV